MKFADQLRFVRQNMKKNKSRLFMTVLATAMGCSFLIVLASVGFGLQKSIVDNVVGDRLVTAIDVYGLEASDGIDRQIGDEQLAYLRSVDHVKAVTYKNNVQQPVAMRMEGAEAGERRMVNVDFEAEASAGFGISAGRLPQADGEVVVGYHVRSENLGEPSAEPPAAAEWLNRTLELEVAQIGLDGAESRKTIPVTVVGVAQKPTREWQTDTKIYVGKITLAEIERFTGTHWGELRIPPSQDNPEGYEPPGLDEPRYYNEVQAIANGANRVKGIVEEIRAQGYYSHSIASELDQINVIFLIMQLGLGFVGTIAVLIASIGIYNTMTMAVTERAQDIGIMKAIGAHPSAIRRIFLLESGMIGLLGAVVGALVAYAVSAAVNVGVPLIVQSFMNESVPADFRFSMIPPYLTLIASLISLAVALASGSRPAVRATRIDVLRALRRDL